MSNSNFQSMQTPYIAPTCDPKYMIFRATCRCGLFRINTSAVKVCDVYSGEEAEMFTIGLDKSGGSMWLLIVENKEEHDWLIDPPSWRKYMGFKIQFQIDFPLP